MMLRLLLMVVITWPAWVTAGDIATEVRRGGSDDNPDRRGHFEVLINGECSHRSGKGTGRWFVPDRSGCGLGLDLGGEYHYKGFFLEAVSESRDGWQIGYTLWSNPSWRVDMVAAGPAFYGSEWSYGIGSRITHHFGDNIFQFRLLAEQGFDDDDVEATMRLGRAWQVRNWNFHALGGLELLLAERYHTYVGEREGEQQLLLGRKRLEPMVDLVFEVGATYPISEHWVSRTQVEYLSRDDERSYSTDWSAAISTSLVYVF